MPPEDTAATPQPPAATPPAAGAAPAANASSVAPVAGADAKPADAKPADAKPATPEVEVVDLLGDKVLDQYPKLKEMQEGTAKGLKYPVEKAWLDKQMEDARFRAYVHGLRGVATKERESTVEEKRAVQADRVAVAAEAQRVREQHTALEAQVARLQGLVDKIPKAPAVPAGGAPDPKSANPKAQEWHAQTFVASLFDGVRSEMDKWKTDATTAGQATALEALRIENDAFINATPDYAAYHADVMKLLEAGEVATPQAGYHVARARKLAVTAAAAPPAPTGPDFAKMSTTEITLYALKNPGWKPSAELKAQIAARK